MTFVNTPRLGPLPYHRFKCIKEKPVEREPLKPESKNPLDLLMRYQNLVENWVGLEEKRFKHLDGELDLTVEQESALYQALDQCIITGQQLIKEQI